MVSAGQLSVDLGGLDDTVLAALTAAFGMRAVAAAALGRVWRLGAFCRPVQFVRVAFVNACMAAG